MNAAAELLRQARQEAGLTQAALARRAGVPRSVLNAYERGHRQPGANALDSILRAAGFTLELHRTIDLEHNARILEQVIDLAEQLPYEPRKRLAFPPFHERVA